MPKVDGVCGVCDGSVQRPYTRGSDVATGSKGTMSEDGVLECALCIILIDAKRAR